MAAVQTVLMVDDLPAVRAGIRQWLDGSYGLAVTGEAATASEAIELAAALRPDVVLMHADLPDCSGAAACQAILKTSPTTSVLLMSDADRDAQLAEAWDAGASGFISRQADLPAIVAALNEAASGKHLFTPAQLRRIQLWRQATGRQLKSLSPRERDVLRLVLLGNTNRQIGMALVLSESTVEKHVGSILSKLGLERRQELLALALRGQLNSTSQAWRT